MYIADNTALQQVLHHVVEQCWSVYVEKNVLTFFIYFLVYYITVAVIHFVLTHHPDASSRSYIMEPNGLLALNCGCCC